MLGFMGLEMLNLTQNTNYNDLMPKVWIVNPLLVYPHSRKAELIKNSSIGACPFGESNQLKGAK